MFSRIAQIIVAGCVLAVFSALATSALKAAEDHSAAVEGHAGGHHAAHIGAAGADSSPAEVKGDLAIYTFAVFLLLLGLLGKYAWGPITEGLDKRERGVLQNIAEAESARIKAEKMLAAHAEKLDKVQDEVREILAEAQRDAEHTKNEILALAQREAEAAKRRATQDIERARDQALDELFTHMARCVAEATGQVMGRSLTEADHDRLIQEALSGISQHG